MKPLLPSELITMTRENFERRQFALDPTRNSVEAGYELEMIDAIDKLIGEVTRLQMIAPALCHECGWMFETLDKLCAHLETGHCPRLPNWETL